MKFTTVLLFHDENPRSGQNAITKIVEEKMHNLKAGNKIKSRKILRFFGVRRKQTSRCCSAAPNVQDRQVAAGQVAPDTGNNHVVKGKVA